MKQSPLLTEFYTAYYLWLKMGAPDTYPFKRGYGLCDALSIWLGGDIDAFSSLEEEMELQFGEAWLDKYYPFGGYKRFEMESINNTAYKNKMRINWVESRLNMA